MRTDANRACDGIKLRLLYDPHYKLQDSSSANLLEVLIALAKRCEDDIMQDSDLGDRTQKWFWIMIDNLGLSGYSNGRFDRDSVSRIVNAFMDRMYDKNGNGSIFYTNDNKKDFRSADLWYQMSWYLDEHFFL